VVAILYLTSALCLHLSVHLHLNVLWMQAAVMAAKTASGKPDQSSDQIKL
jgi:hypothetical protein